MRWPGHIPPAGLRRTADDHRHVPDDRPAHRRQLPEHKIDGLDITDVITGKTTKSPHEVLFFYYGQNNLEALRSGKWKLELPRYYQSLNGHPGGHGGMPAPYDSLKIAAPELYDLDADPGQKHNVADRYPDVLAKMLAYAEQAREEFGDGLTHHPGTGRRSPGGCPIRPRSRRARRRSELCRGQTCRRPLCHFIDSCRVEGSEGQEDHDPISDFLLRH